MLTGRGSPPPPRLCCRRWLARPVRWHVPRRQGLCTRQRTLCTLCEACVWPRRCSGLRSRFRDCALSPPPCGLRGRVEPVRSCPPLSPLPPPPAPLPVPRPLASHFFTPPPPPPLLVVAAVHECGPAAPRGQRRAAGDVPRGAACAGLRPQQAHYAGVHGQDPVRFLPPPPNRACLVKPTLVPSFAVPAVWRVGDGGGGWGGGGCARQQRAQRPRAVSSSRGAERGGGGREGKGKRLPSCVWRGMAVMRTM
jgi:hypothetical protein